jgi:DNA-binding Lrp family transcriptional regulator
LQQDARLTTAQLADRIGLSTTPCWNRLKRLETQGYIDGYVALLNQEKLGLPETVIIEVTLDHHDEEVLARFGQLLADLPEVIEAYLTTGDYDYVVKVAVESTAGYETRAKALSHSRHPPQPVVLRPALPEEADLGPGLTRVHSHREIAFGCP